MSPTVVCFAMTASVSRVPDVMCRPGCQCVSLSEGARTRAAVLGDEAAPAAVTHSSGR